jgi:radical SAM/Cys-rich protein
MPIQRFGALLTKRNEMDAYLALLRANHRHDNVQKVMCRNLISIDWRGYLYDCDFNQMLDLPVAWGDRPHLSDLLKTDVKAKPIRVAGHCFGCTAGQGSSCGGALKDHVSETPARARQDRAIDEGLEAVE